ncbi:MAG: hypothetical protein HZB13_07470 [Acidobacteria bacterium]|nr:hypothetical protein [Acidobacteriota bacterium]
MQALTPSSPMLPRQRVFAALDFTAPDRVPLEYHPSPAGAYEHGNKLRALGLTVEDDFYGPAPFPPAAPDPRWIDANGTYRELRRDEWGVLWQYLIFGVAGHPLERPLDDWSNLPSYQPPPLLPTSGPEFLESQSKASAHQQRYFLKSGWISIFEVMIAVRLFEDVLMDLATDLNDDAPEINALADLITDYRLAEIHHLLARGVDAIQFGDDFGTQSAMMISPRIWRRFFRPRYQRLVAPILAAGKKVFFHTCGCNLGILDDIAALGVHAIWPQLNSYDLSHLAQWSRQARVAVALHPERGGLMTRGTSEDVRCAVNHLAEAFRVADGGAWFYVEIDSGFPFSNVEALIQSIARLRGA